MTDVVAPRTSTKARAGLTWLGEKRKTNTTSSAKTISACLPTLRREPMSPIGQERSDTDDIAEWERPQGRPLSAGQHTDGENQEPLGRHRHGHPLARGRILEGIEEPAPRFESSRKVDGTFKGSFADASDPAARQTTSQRERSLPGTRISEIARRSRLCMCKSPPSLGRFLCDTSAVDVELHQTLPHSETTTGRSRPGKGVRCPIRTPSDG